MTISSEPSSRAPDRLLAAAFFGLTQVEIWVFDAGDGFSPTVRLGAAMATAIASLALAERRTRPVAMFIANSLAVSAAIAVGYSSDFYQWTNLIATYSIAAHGTARQSWLALPFSLGSVAFYFVRFPAEGGAVITGFAIAMWTISWLAGRVYGSRVEQIRIAAERDLSLQLAQAREERLRTEHEKTQIARELHDAIGHGVNVMVIHAGAGRGAIDSDPESARRSFKTIEEAGRRALDELDRVLALLREDDSTPNMVPVPGLSDIPELIGTFRSAGLEVDLQHQQDGTLVPQSVGLNAYRIVQEALTNVSRHSTSTWARVDMQIVPGVLRLEVRSAPVAGLVDEGRGLVGMRERAALHGGEIEISSTAEHFAVSADLTWDGP